MFEQVLGALGSKAIESGIDNMYQYYAQKSLNEQQQSNIQKNMKLSAQLALQNQFQSVAQSTAAMRAAGLNPALMNGASAQIAGVGAPLSPSGGQMGRSNTGSMAENVLAAKQIALLDAQRRNIEADTEVKHQDVSESQARTPTYESTISLNSKQEEMIDSLVQKYGAEWLFLGQQYKRMLDADDKATQLIREQYQYRSNLAEKQGNYDLAKYWQDLADNSNELSVGTLYAMRDFASYVNDLDEYDKQMIARALQKQLLNMQLSDGSILYDLAHMPVAEFEKLIADTADAYASRDMRLAYANVGIPAEASYRDQMEKTTRHNDFVGNIKDGNYMDAAMSQVPNLLHLVEEGAMIYMLRGRVGPGTQLPGGAPFPRSPSVPSTRSSKGSYMPDSEAKKLRDIIDYQHPAATPAQKEAIFQRERKRWLEKFGK